MVYLYFNNNIYIMNSLFSISVTVHSTHVKYMSQLPIYIHILSTYLPTDLLVRTVMLTFKTLHKQHYTTVQNS